jgi:hypothetical protein
MAGNRNSGKLNWEEARIKSPARYETARKMRAGRLQGCRRSHGGSNAGDPKSANVFTQCTVSFAMTSLSLIIRKSLQLDFLAIV